MAELNDNSTTIQTPKEPQKIHQTDKPTVVDIKFSLTKRRKIILALTGSFLILLASFLIIWFTDLKYTVFGAFTTATAEIIVADSETLQPIEGATVQINGRTGETDSEGKVILVDLKLGPKKLKVTKEAYKNFGRDEVIFIGTNKLKPVVLEGSGISVSFIVKDKVTEQPIEGAEVEVNKNKVKTAKDGTAILSVLPQDDVKAIAKISKEGFIQSSLELKVEQNAEPFIVLLTPSGKNYFLSNRKGKIDLYQSNLDGSKQKVILAATGNEESNTRINVSPDNKWIALISTREALKGASGTFIPVLYLVNPKDKSLSKIDTEVSILIIGWIGDYLIYRTSSVAYGENAKVKIVSFNTSSKKKTTLVSTSIFPSNTQFLGDNIIYTLTDKKVEDYGLFIINTDGSNRKTILKETVYLIYRKTPYSFIFQSADSNKWYSYNSDSKKLVQLSSKPPSLKNKSLILSPNKKYTAFVEKRDGKNELYLADNQGKNEKKLTSLGSVTTPIRWIGEDYIVFRSSSTNENADYIIGRKGGKQQKIVDVYNQPTYQGN